MISLFPILQSMTLPGMAVKKRPVTLFKQK